MKINLSSNLYIYVKNWKMKIDDSVGHHHTSCWYQPAAVIHVAHIGGLVWSWTNWTRVTHILVLECTYISLIMVSNYYFFFQKINKWKGGFKFNLLCACVSAHTSHMKQSNEKKLKEVICLCIKLQADLVESLVEPK